MSKSTHGGARKGAGKPPMPELTTVPKLIRFPRALVPRLAKLMSEDLPSFNRVVVQACEEKLERHRKR